MTCARLPSKRAGSELQDTELVSRELSGTLFQLALPWQHLYRSVISISGHRVVMRLWSLGKISRDKDKRRSVIDCGFIDEIILLVIFVASARIIRQRFPSQLAVFICPSDKHSRHGSACPH